MYIFNLYYFKLPTRFVDTSREECEYT